MFPGAGSLEANHLLVSKLPLLKVSLRDPIPLTFTRVEALALFPLLSVIVTFAV